MYTFSRWKLFLTISAFLFTFSSCSDRKQELEKYPFSGTTMGTTYSVSIVDEPQKFLNTNIHLSVDSLLIEINKQMSTYIPNSEISKFNASQDTSWFKVSKDFALLVDEAKTLSVDSENAYDVTIGPLVNLWGFGAEEYSGEIPNEKEIAEIKKIIGTDKIEVDLAKSSIRKLVPNLYLDLSSIAKGFGVDQVGQLIEESGFVNYMVEIGGEVRTKGVNDKGENWKIGISAPEGRNLQKVIAITDMSVATSGDYQNYKEENGVRYSHLIDPRIGKPIMHNLASVTVLHQNCRTADALATAINIMGHEEGYSFALKKELPIFMIVRDSNTFIEKMTPQFNEFILERD
jgi:thiamine biosynthesis lipoprotein